MNRINRLPLNGVTEEYHDIRIKQSKRSDKYYRELTSDEIIKLKSCNNICHNWSHILVTEKFIPEQIINCRFSGRVRIDDMEPISLEFHDIIVPVGIYNSEIRSCDIGKNCSIQNVTYLSRVILGESVILKENDEIGTSDHAKFGNGIVKDGENPDHRIELEIANEAGGREILPFDKMLTSDAWLWYKYRANNRLQSRLKEFVESEYDSKRGYYGFIGDRTIIKNCRIIKDVTIGSDAYIKGANKLKNITIKSSAKHKTQIGEGVILVNGIVGEGCKVFYSAVAVRFHLMDHSSLKYGARLLNSVLGENSTISCCEVLNSFIFPGHEQHHNSSFLIAATLMGQTNIASGATIGSNHNSRKNDGEIVAGRGFWPGLNCSLKHDSKFSSYNIVVKGNYKAEINNPLPFSLIFLNNSSRLEVYPAYWFVHNMYALKRNSWKYGVRDRREENHPFLEFDFLAPDSVSEMLEARAFLESSAEYSYRKISSEECSGRDLLLNYEDYGNFSVYSPFIENKNPGVKIHKPSQAYEEFRKMITLYAVRTILEYVDSGESLSKLPTGDYNSWINCGGQLIPKFRVDKIISDIEDGRINSWDDLHDSYRECAELYISDKTAHALEVFKTLYNVESITSSLWLDVIEDVIETRKEIKDRVFQSREKDFNDKFRTITFDSIEEKEAVIGKLEDNDFFRVEEEECLNFIELCNREDLEKIF